MLSIVGSFAVALKTDRRIQMRKYSLMLFIILSSLFASAANADCLTNLFSGLNSFKNKNYQLTIQKQNNQWVSYSSGVVYKPTGWTNLYGGIVRQLFSDRTYWNQGNLQPFSALAVDYMEVQSITPQGVMTVYNSTWNFTWSVNFTCQGNLLTGSTSDVFVVLSVGPII
jgi:hypothetical protein